MFRLLTSLLLTVALVFAGEPIRLTSENFDSLTHLNDNSTGLAEPWFIKFYAPWCPHCKKLIPHWEKVVDEIGHEFNVAELDATVYKDIAKRYKVSGYPTILFFNDNKVWKYKGNRVADKLCDFVRGGYIEAEPLKLGDSPKKNLKSPTHAKSAFWAALWNIW